MVDALETHKQDIDSRCDAAMMVFEGRLTSRRVRHGVQMLSRFSRQADGDGVSPSNGWLHGKVDALESHEQGVDRQRCDVVRYGSSRGRLTSGRPMSSFTAMVSRCFPVSLGQPMVTTCPQEKAGYMDWLVRLVPTNKVSTDLKYSTLMSRTHSWGSMFAKAMCSHPGDFVRAQCRCGGGVSSVATQFNLNVVDCGTVSDV